MNLQKIISLHGKLAERIKQFETNLNIHPPIEVSNELRYALRAVIEILELNGLTEQTQKTQEALAQAKQKAYHALICAYHDLIDGLTIHVTITLDELRDKYLEESIVVLGSERNEIIDFINAVNEKIALSRKHPEQRVQIYDEELYDHYFLKLVSYRKLLTGRLIEDIVKLHLQKKAEKAKKDEEAQKMTNRFIIGTMLTLIVITLSVVKIAFY